MSIWHRITVDKKHNKLFGVCAGIANAFGYGIRGIHTIAKRVDDSAITMSKEVAQLSIDTGKSFIGVLSASLKAFAILTAPYESLH